VERQSRLGLEHYSEAVTFYFDWAVCYGWADESQAEAGIGNAVETALQVEEE